MICILLTKTIKIKVRKNLKDYYNQKGYDCEAGDEIEINTMDLPPHSSIRVKYQCDNPECRSIHEIKFEDYLKKGKREYSSWGDFCDSCSKKIRKKWMLENKPEE